MDLPWNTTQVLKESREYAFRFNRKIKHSIKVAQKSAYYFVTLKALKCL